MHHLATVTDNAATGWFEDELAAAAADTAGQVALIQRCARAGQMPPLVRRSQRETYRVTDGEVVFFVGTDTVCAGPGDVVVVPRDVPHAFRVASAEARWLVLTHVNSLDRYNEFARAVSRPHPHPERGWPSADERRTVAAMAAANGIELLGPPGALPS